jgi:hypothetical protein
MLARDKVDLSLIALMKATRCHIQTFVSHLCVCVHYMLAYSSETRHTCTVDRRGLSIHREPQLKCSMAYLPAPYCRKSSRRVFASPWYVFLLFHSCLGSASSEEGAVLDTRRTRHLPQIILDVQFAIKFVEKQYFVDLQG